MNFRFYLPAAFVLTFHLAFSQQNFSPTQQKIATALSAYFALERENIHLHLNKNIYLTNENIWFKGYVIEKKSGLDLLSSNIYATLFDSNGKKVSSQLYYAENGIFEGRIKLNNNLASGKYYIQAFTNFMNNFAENESSVYEITVLNKADKGYNNSSKPNPATAKIDFFPESGNFIKGVSNTVGLRISDCNSIGIQLQNGEVIDSKGNVISKFATDQFGYAKFDLLPTEGEMYKARILTNDIKLEKVLPIAASEGISLSVVNYANSEKTLVKLKTNPKTLEKIKNKPYQIVFQKNDKVVFAGCTFKDNATEQLLSIANAELPDGTTTVYLIDEHLLKIAERIIYTPYKISNPKTLLNIAYKNTDSIAITGVSSLLLGKLSISVLPENSLSAALGKPIQSDLQFDNYLQYASGNTAYYLNDFSRRKHFELDNFLICEKSKYDWDSMMQKAPVKSFEHDAGLTIKGTINSDVRNLKTMMINMKSLTLGLNEYTRPNEKNEFTFEHVLAQDSTKIYFLAIDDRVKKPEIKIYSQLLNNVRNFMKPLVINGGCPTLVSKEESIPFPKIQGAIMMDSINVQASSMKYGDRAGNRTARGFKISDKDIASNRDILQFLKNNGYSVRVRDGITFILDMSQNQPFRPYETDPQQRGPSIYIDGNRLMNYDVLENYTLDRVDEIYINKRFHDISRSESMGIIQIYSKTKGGIPIAPSKSQALLVKNGFQGYMPFTNIKYDSYNDDGFRKLGTIDWIPFINTDENGTFRFAIANTYQKTVQLVIEGLAPDGTMVSETITLNTN